MPRAHIAPIYLLLVWLGVNLIQAAFTPLDPDETYYWMYADRLAWGYYDHPPVVALLVAFGKDWLPGSLGLRLGHVLVSGLTLLGLWHLLERPRGSLLWLAAGLALAQPMLNVYGFIATPDGPLLLFAVWYLIAYRRFLRAPSVARGALWGLTMAGLLYSKYHGLVFILFSVLPHLFWLLRQPGAWVAALGGAALYLPHLYWQYAHDFPSFRYHLQGRNDPYQFKYTTGYLANQLAIFSPFLLWYYVKTFWKDGAYGDRFLRACRWLVLGFLAFFLYMTSKGRTEAQWTAVLAFPLVYLCYVAARDRFPAWRRGIWRMSLLTILILSLARVLLMLPRQWLPFQKPFDHAPWTAEMAVVADGRPVIFENSYRLASLYEFYTGQPSWTFTDVNYRRNQYDLWAADSAFHDRPVLLAGQRSWQWPAAESFDVFRGTMKLAPVERFQVLQAVRLEASALPDTLQRGLSYPVTITGLLPAEAGIDAVDFAGELPVSLYVTFHSRADASMRFVTVARPQVQGIERGQPSTVFRGRVRIPDDITAGEGRVEFGLGYAAMPPIREMMPLRGVYFR